MKRKAFIFNINKCVSCMACVAGCSIENGTLPAMNWREINGFNTIRHPDLPVFHFSLACNHCEDAPCMQSCPANAYTRDLTTGAIIHHAEACIGCKLCTWVCPYDAPKYNPQKGIVEKCTFCVERIAEDKAPACVDACPTEALSYGYEDISEEDILIPGFVNKSVRPAIKIIPLREESKNPEIWNLDASKRTVVETLKLVQKPKSKVRLQKEWSLVLFTLSVAFLIAWYVAHLAHNTPLKPEWFIPAGGIIMLISSVHLGKKLKAWRAVLNIRRSWLSREILFITAFLILGSLYLIRPNNIIGSIAAWCGFFTLLSIDALYRFFERREKIITHSASTLLTSSLIFSYLSNIEFIFIFILGIKMALYLYRKIIFIKQKTPCLIIPSIIRISVLLISLIVWFQRIPSHWWLIPGMLIVGEIIDRIEFYHEAEVTSPDRNLYKLYKKAIHEET